jgi:hypothetical protein
MREKKSWKKNTMKMNEEVQHMMMEKNDEEQREADMNKLSNEQLFSLNAAKNDKKRAKLRKDRFEDKKRVFISKNEAVLSKRLAAQKERRIEVHQGGDKQPESDEYEMVDPWATPSDMGKNRAAFYDFKKKQMP